MKINDKDFSGPFNFNFEELPESGAVYLITEGDEIVYCGYSNNLKIRLKTMAFASNLANLHDAKIWYWKFTPLQIEEARELEKNIQKNLMPRFNKISTGFPKGPDIDREYAKAKYGFIKYWFIFNKTSVTQILILFGSIAALIAILLLFSDRFPLYLAEGLHLDRTNFSFVSFTALATSVASFALVYLQSGGGAESQSSVSRELSALRAKNIRMNADLTEVKKSVTEKFEDIRNREAAEYLSESERASLLETVAKNAGHDVIKEIFASETSKVKLELERKTETDKLRLASEGILSRMRREINDLRLRANINLVIGMIITGGGLYLLWSTVLIIDSSQLLKTLANESADSDKKFFKNLMLPILPRIMIVVFVEIFAYFFLQLYKSGLAEIKYFQNEITNVEAKILAVEFSCITGRRDFLKIPFENLARTERNFVLQKGQTTIEIEKFRLENQTSKTLLKILPNFFKDKD
jgi:predicted GIY-YIG superfamily endonuclease